tara:strand:- start:15446 stop:20104 length:4659 start_codon:yes stop_codon:yes gene_type:complete
MPRINNKIRSSKKSFANYYDHSEKYTSQKTELKYTSQDSLIFWSEFCGKPTGNLDAFETNNQKIATDRSKDSSSIELYAPKSTAAHIHNETQSQYVISLLPDDLQKNLDITTLDVCGDPCFLLNLSTVAQVPDTENCGILTTGADYLFAENNSLLNFVDSGEDKPFTISIWYYPIDFNDSRATHYNKGGTSRLSSPTIFHKALQYGLFIRECGKLEFVLFDTAITSSIASSPTTAYTYSGTSSSLTVRSNENVLVPGQWNHISVTYDGSATRAGMKIYVNCNNVVNTSDVPNTVAEKSRSVSSITNAALWNATHQALMYDIYNDDRETPADYEAMHSYATPLVFAGSALPPDAASMIGLSLSSVKMSGISKLPPSFIFDIALWSTALSAEEVGAVCDATRNCIIAYSDFFGRDSGYINLSPKIMQKIRDQKQNSLSVIDRVGDRSDRRVKSRKPFDDKHTLLFGRKISDEFNKGNHRFESLNLTNKEVLFGIPKSGIAPDTNLWVAQNAIIKWESKNDALGNPIYETALGLYSLGSPHHLPGTDPNAFIQTKEKVNNAIINYDLILGPYNKSLGRLNLSSVPESGTNLFIEIQTTDGTPWQIVKTHTITSVTSLTATRFYSPDYDNNGIAITSNQHQFRRSFSIHFSSINSGGEPYKIRFRTLESCWGIGKIEILSANQVVRQPLLIDHDSYSGEYIDQNFIATPHTRSDITSTGRTVSGISDSSIYFSDDDQGSTPFKDNTMLPFAGSTFFDTGVDTAVVPGYSSPLKDKTLLTIELNATSEKDIGFTNQFANGLAGTDFLGGDDINNITDDTISRSVPQPVNICWNNTSKSYVSKAAFQGWVSPSIPSFVAENGIAFSSIDSIGSGSTGTGSPSKLEFYHPREALTSYAQPVTSFGFPSSEQFFEEHDSCIKMSDYISKPFLLEKIVLEFDGKFEFAKTGKASTNAVNAYGISIGYNNTTTNKPSQRLLTGDYMLMPAFSLLKVGKNSGKNYSRNAKIINIDDTVSFVNENYTTADSIFGPTRDRREAEVITYGQIAMHASSSNSSIASIDTLLNLGLERESVFNINEKTDQINFSAGLNPITASFRIEVPVKNLPVVSETQRIYLRDYVEEETYAIFPGNPSGGRSINQINDLNSQETNQAYTFSNSNRGIIGNYNSIDQKNEIEYKLNSLNNASLPIDVKTSGNISNDGNISPYLLFPEDRITLTFHYPIPQNGYACTPGSTDTTFNKMTIGKNTKIHLYGSLIKEGREFHENMNQALTTVEITEPIGCESVVDQFNISTRDEYFKTYLDKIPLGILGSTAAATPNSVYSFENRETGFGTSLIFGTATPEPSSRIGLKFGSKVHNFVTYQVASASITEQGILNSSYYVHDFIGNYISAENQPSLGTIFNKTGLTSLITTHIYRKTFTFPFTEHYNNERRFFDEGRLEDDVSGKKLGKNQQIKSRERYIFSHKSFGQYTDLIDSSKYSKFKNIIPDLDSPYNLLNTAINVANDYVKYNSSPVNIVFVSGTMNENNIQQYHSIPNSIAAISNNKTYNSTITSAFNDFITS